MSTLEMHPRTDDAPTSAGCGPARPAGTIDDPSDRPGADVLPGFCALVPHEFARRHLVLGLAGAAGWRLAHAGTSSRAAIHNLATRLGRGRAAAFVVQEPEVLARAIDAAYAAVARGGPRAGPEAAAPLAVGPVVDSDGTDSRDVALELDAAIAAGDRDLLATAGKGPVVRFVDRVLFEALGRRASDIHIQPLADRTLVRYRVDGVLHTAHTLPSAAALPVVSRIKVMGRLDIAERRVPQDGRAAVTIGQLDRAERSAHRSGRPPPAADLDSHARAIDLRLSTLPTSYGERIVIRLLDTRQARSLGDFEALGMPSPVRRAFLACASRSSGIILATGPTGSGKTTTLYSTLQHIARGAAAGLSVMTIEDPIEYELSTPAIAISQAQVNNKKGITFARGLRHILRQDPDVIMVGEIRDEETARIAIQASLTGHLVLSTLHTSDAATAVTRLADLGVEPYLVGASLACVLAQRLVRRIHAPCRGQGCEACFATGFHGRIGVFELLTIDEALRTLIAGRADASALREAARARGMRPLRDAGMSLVAEGLTTRAEVERVAHLLDESDDAMTSSIAVTSAVDDQRPSTANVPACTRSHLPTEGELP